MQNPCYMLTGVRGTGKTVTLTEIEKEIAKDKITCFRYRICVRNHFKRDKKTKIQITGDYR